MLGKPISAQAIEISIQVSLHRADDESIAVIGATNLPNGTKLLVTLTRSNDTKIMGQGSATVLDGLFFSGGFVNKTKPHAHAWYSVRVFAGFNQPWNQPAGVIDIVGREGERLIGRFAELAHPEFAESEKRFRAVFDCVAPPLLHHGMPTSQPPQTKQAVDLVRNAFLEIEDEPSVAPVGEVVNWFMSFSDLREADGWQVRQLPNGSYLVSFSYLDGENSATAELIAILESSEVRYANLHGKYMSHLRD